MKKIIFSALVALVAVGGALSTNASARRVFITSGPLNSTVSSGQCTQRDISCQLGGTNPCTINPSDPTSTQLYATDGTECTQFLSKL